MPSTISFWKEGEGASEEETAFRQTDPVCDFTYIDDYPHQ